MASRATLPNLAFRAFTLIELLVVIALIGILSAILIPTVGSARVSANKAKTKVLFSQWATAMEQFKQEYGYYPAVDNGTGKIIPERFVAALTGRDLAGNQIPTATDPRLCGNTKRIAFYTLGESELNETRTAIVDPFGNTDIAVYYDRDNDARITGADGRADILAVAGSRGSFVPTREDFDLTAGVRAGLIFYSAGRGHAETDIIYSWR
jgi:prepilin-type N-terminal cleavage/methylation domain-containing protein